MEIYNISHIITIYVIIAYITFLFFMHNMMNNPEAIAFDDKSKTIWILVAFVLACLWPIGLPFVFIMSIYSD